MCNKRNFFIKHNRKQTNKTHEVKISDFADRWQGVSGCSENRDGEGLAGRIFDISIQRAAEEEWLTKCKFRGGTVVAYSFAFFIEI